MRKTKEILDELKIPFWLDCGTLLFVYRNSVPDLVDTDFAIYEKDLPRLSANLDHFTKNGFTIYQVYTHPKKGTTEISFKYNELKVDIFVKFMRGKWAYTIANNNGKYIIGKWPRKHFIKLDSHRFDGKIWKIPNCVEDYLAEYYGDDWRTPKPDWDWANDAPCIDRKFKTLAYQAIID